MDLAAGLEPKGLPALPPRAGTDSINGVRGPGFPILVARQGLLLPPPKRLDNHGRIATHDRPAPTAGQAVAETRSGDFTLGRQDKVQTPNRNTLAFISGPAVLALALALCPGAVPAGPVPGVESTSGAPVDFPFPGHLSVTEAGPDEYFVEFRWTPGAPVQSPGIAGSFNSWSRDAWPMSDPDGDGTYTAVVRLGGGEYQYKFVSGSDGWHQDPLNPDTAPSGGGEPNSVLRLGIAALLRDMVCERGDGRMEERGFLHDPGVFTYYDTSSEGLVTLRFRTVRDDVERVEVSLAGGGVQMDLPMTLAAGDEIYDYFERTVSVHEVEADFGGAGGIVYSFTAFDGDARAEHDASYSLTIPDESPFHTPAWARSAVWYQIMVDRFRDGDPTNNPEHLVGSSTRRSTVTHPWTSDWYTEQPWENDGKGKTFWEWSMYERLYGGDFQGVIDKLDYLHGLGVTAIYLNPVFEGTSAHKYNARSYLFADDGYGVAGEFDRANDPDLGLDRLDPATWFFNGSDEKLLELIRECHKRDMKIILDGVFNHLGDDAVTFLDVRENGRDSRYADWYDVTSWEPFEYVGWAGFGGLPSFAKDPEKGLASDALTQHILDVTTRWMDPNGDGDPSDGIDGWRLDVPFDVPMPFWRLWREHVKSINPEAYLVGEVWDPAESWLQGDTFDAVMNYQFSQAAIRFFANRERKTTATQFDRELSRLRIRYPRSATYVLQNLFDSHDTDRWVSQLANPDRDYDANNRLQDPGGENYMDERPAEEHYQRLALMAIFQATYVGAPMIWYGTEVGMFGADDPMCRMPMWWDDLGPYENPEYVIRRDLREHFRTLFHLRRDLRVLTEGEFMTLVADDAKDCFVYLRYAPARDGGTGDAGGHWGPPVLVALNNSGEHQRIVVERPAGDALPSGFDRAQCVYPPGRVSVAGGALVLDLPPVSGKIVTLEQARPY